MVGERRRTYEKKKPTAQVGRYQHLLNTAI